MSDTIEEAPSRTRIGGVDLARAVAVVGMLAVHVGPTDAGGVAGWLYAVPHGRASILFGLLAGVGVSLLAASRTASSAQVRAKLLWRAVVLLPLGLALQELDHRVFVILADYALLFLLAIVVLHWTDRALLVGASISATVGAAAYLWGVLEAPDRFSRQAASWGDPVGVIVDRLVLTGPYPLITWAAPVLVGMWLGRRDLRQRSTQVRLLVVGGGVAVVTAIVSALVLELLGGAGGLTGWWTLASDAAHSQMPLWLLGATGSAAFVLGGSLLTADAAPRWTWPPVALGQLAFTFYVGHLVVLHSGGDALRSSAVGEAVGIVLAFTGVAVLGATGWRAAFARGPLELLLQGPWLVATDLRSTTRR